MIHVQESRESAVECIENVRKLTLELGGAFEIVPSEEPVDAVLAFAYRQFVTTIVVGESLKSQGQKLLRGSFVQR